ncbi:MAG: acyl-CoA-binding protein [Bacteroidia bacterium]|nr:acyl-CoA-binding protein [Bacteroidia bacterium]NNF30374.1 acyl-CoA-binding protein [Flavobacteriaceae bacterium]MBT8276450.1 acyl-CoA-binding protein [Bacteroidia bacterium]NNJ81164.1 acyl-CoA-binding protein [Flavobacteriaceae bacterium]NNK53481.1 acyl-CoA-binding protein [Flavobacteriaceae bacterium]
MAKSDLDIEFRKAVDSINKHTEPFPADVLLRLYAYYKVATNDEDRPSGGKPLINAFKTNALFQAQNLSVEEAKQLYIETVKNYFIYRK